MTFKFFRDKDQVDPWIYTEDQLMARLRFFIGVCLALTLTGIVFVVLYSIIFVTQPLNAMSPIDQKFFELIIPIATFLTGTLSGIMLAGKDDKEAKMKALEAATRSTPVSSNPSNSGTSGMGGLSASASFGGASMSFNKPMGGFGAPGAAATAPSFGTPAPFVASSGKLGPAQDPHPEI